MVVNGRGSSAEGMFSTAIGGNVQIKQDDHGAVAVSAYYPPYSSLWSLSTSPCESSGYGSLTLCATTHVNVTGSAFYVNGIDILAELARLKADLQKCTGSGRRLDTGCACDKATASGLLVGTLLALSLTATAVA